MGIPKLKFLRRGHTCNYCQAVHGVTFHRPPNVKPRIHWIRCICGKKHYICEECLPLLRYDAEVEAGGKLVKVRLTVCAKGYSKKTKGATT